VALLHRLVQPFSDLVRWGEPWDVEDDDPLFDSGPSRSDEAFNLWS
jgi:hypothetical protein